MQNVYQQIRQAASTDISILITGETGTGKDLAANSIHRLSSCSNGPYIPVNLGALPSELTTSELFGHEAGAFTGAKNQHIGVFEQGRNGTVFLDEIDAIDDKVQISLLRLIEQKKFKRLGGRTFHNTNARLITASNADLEELVKQGVFREDLFYRIDVFRIVIPPLRERLEDIPLLVENLVARYNQQFRKNVQHIAPETINNLSAYEWPGNIRELKNVIQRAILVNNEGELKPTHLPARFQKIEYTPDEILSFKIGTTTLNTMEQELIHKVLSYTNNNRKRSAEILGISRRALYNKLKKYSID
jgi:transcriptional regulator with PAS, ATPase and Fis domain